MDAEPAVLVAVQVYAPELPRRTGAKVKTPPEPVGRTRPSNIHVMEGVGSPAALQVIEWAVFSNTELLLMGAIVGGTAEEGGGNVM